MRFNCARRAIIRLVLTSAAVAALSRPSVGNACGALASEVHLLLPMQDDVDVPLNALLHASTVVSQATFELFEDESGEPVPLSVSCDGPFNSSALCVASAGPLQPETAYRWRAYPTEFGAGEVEERRFVTGSATAEGFQGVPDWSLALVSDEASVGVGCGKARLATFELTVVGAAAPLMVTIPGSVPSFFQRVPLVTPNGGAVQFQIAEPSDCFPIRVNDVAGNALVVGSYCFEESGRAQPDGGTTPSESPQGGCAVTRRQSQSGLSAMLLALAACLARRHSVKRRT
jgi:hypothetical protein